jgi:hypothetical protein
MTNIILNNSIVYIKIINKNIYYKFKNIDISNHDMVQFEFIYKYLSIICNNHEIKYIMILDFTTTNVNVLNATNNIPRFIRLLNYMKPLTNINIKYSIIILQSEIIKYIINMVLNIYKTGRPLYIISNEDDIKNLIA